MAPTVAIIIPTLNEQANIRATLRALRGCGHPIVVVDGGSVDNTCDVVLKAAQIEPVTLEITTAGRGHQMKVGAESVAAADCFLFLHSDCRISSRAVSRLSQMTAEQQQPFWGCFRQKIRNKKFVYRIIEQGNSLRAKYLKRPFGDQAMFVSRSAFEAIGGVPDCQLMEDVIMSQRLAKLAPPVVLDERVWCSSRRWDQNGPIRQTLKNWRLQLFFALGASTDKLSKIYHRKRSKSDVSNQ